MNHPTKIQSINLINVSALIRVYIWLSSLQFVLICSNLILPLIINRARSLSSQTIIAVDFSLLSDSFFLKQIILSKERHMTTHACTNVWVASTCNLMLQLKTLWCYDKIKAYNKSNSYQEECILEWSLYVYVHGCFFAVVSFTQGFTRQEIEQKQQEKTTFFITNQK